MSEMLTLPTLRSANRFIASWIGICVTDERLVELGKVLQDAMVSLEIKSEEELLEQLRFFSPAVASFLVQRLTIPETYFFRDKEVFNGLGETLLPDRIERALTQGSSEVVVWCAACSSGEEAYSVAAVAKSLVPSLPRVRVLASDINPVNIAQAKEGRYRLWSFREKIPPQFEQFFVEEGYNSTLVTPDLRDAVEFFELNLFDLYYPPPLDQQESVDIIFCRNALMYFSQEAKQRVVDRFAGLLKPHGYLIVAPCELSSICHPQLESNRLNGFHGLKKTLQEREQPLACLSRTQDDVPRMRGNIFRQPQTPSSVRRDSVPVSLSRTRTSERSRRSKHPVSAQKTPIPAKSTQSSQEGVSRAHPPDSSEQRQLAEEMFLQAMESLEVGEKQEALVCLRKTLYLDSTFVMAHVQLGFLVKGSIGRRHLERAISLLEKRPADAIVPFGDASVETILEALRDMFSRTSATQINPQYSESI